MTSEEDAIRIKKQLNDAGIEVGENDSCAITKETIKTLGKMDLKDFDRMVQELYEMLVLLKTPGGKAILRTL